MKSWLTLDVFSLPFLKSKYCHDFIISEMKKCLLALYLCWGIRKHIILSSYDFGRNGDKEIVHNNHEHLWQFSAMPKWWLQTKVTIYWNKWWLLMNTLVNFQQDQKSLHPWFLTCSNFSLWENSKLFDFFLQCCNGIDFALINKIY